MKTPHDVIEEIRKIRFLEGLETAGLSPTQKAALEDKRKMTRDAARLTDEINTRKPHFLLELIQNADDNTYESGVSPRLRFRLDNGLLIVQNNELGFTEKNAWALCGIGESTKKDKAQGYIGEKGIGFKSVFLVTDEPAIFSNGFHYKFVRVIGQPESIIKPHWMTEIPTYVDLTKTNIVLPLKDNNAERAREYFKEIDPSLLLFVRRLESIELIDTNAKTMTRTLRGTLTEIKYGSQSRYWKTIGQVIKIPKSVKEERRKNLNETEIILAFPTTKRGAPSAKATRPVFSFLPVRDYGFRFIVQADFLLPLSREDIIKDKPWNTFLRDSVAQVFLKAVEDFKQDGNMRNTYYCYLDLNQVKDEYFLPVVYQIVDGLKASKCVLSASDKWRSPNEVVDAEPEVRNLIPNSSFYKLTGKEYVANTAVISQDVKRILGIRKFRPARMLEFLRKKDWVKRHDSSWFARLYHYLGNVKLTDEQVKNLRSLDIFKLENGRMTSLDDGPVFFPLVDSSQEYGFEREMRFMNSTVFNDVTKLGGRRGSAYAFLRRVGIKEAQPVEIINDFILPVYEDQWKETDEVILMGHVKYIKDHLNDFIKESKEEQSAIKALGEQLMIRIHDKDDDDCIYYLKPSETYLSRQYGNTYDLEGLFKGIEAEFVHPCYLENSENDYKERSAEVAKEIKEAKSREASVEVIKRLERRRQRLRSMKDKEAKGWGEFFSRIGVNKGLRITEVDTWSDISYFTDEERQEVRREVGEERERGEILKDYDIEYLEDILKEINPDRGRILLTMLKNQWKSISDRHQLSYKWSYYKWYGPIERDATWLFRLKQNRWIPSGKSALVKPAEAFLERADVQGLLGKSVPYVNRRQMPKEMMTVLGINETAQVAGVINHLKSRVDGTGHSKQRYRRFYVFLANHYEEDPELINGEFSENCLIFVPGTEKKFYRTGDVYWNDYSAVLGGSYAYVKHHYPDLREFFVNKLGIREKPSPADFADLVKRLSRKSELTSMDAATVLRMYEELDAFLGPKGAKPNIAAEEWWNDFRTGRYYLVEGHDGLEFTHNNNDVFIADNKRLYDLFRGNEKVYFLNLPENFHPERIKSFIEKSNIRYLSESIQIKPLLPKENIVPDIDWTELLTDRVHYSLQYLYWEDVRTYTILKKTKRIGQLLNLSVCRAARVQAEYNLEIGDGFQVKVIDSEPFLCDTRVVYVEAGAEAHMGLAHEIARAFGIGGGYANFLTLLLKADSLDGIKEILQIEGLKNLPSAEKAFIAKSRGKATAPTTTDSESGDHDRKASTLTRNFGDVSSIT